MIQRIWLTSFFTLAIAASWSSDATAADRHKHAHHAKKTHEASRHTAAHRKHRHATHAAAKRRKAERAEAASPKAETPPLSGDLAAVKQAFELARKGKTGEATNIQKTLGDPAARKLVEWFILRHPDSRREFQPLRRIHRR